MRPAFAFDLAPEKGASAPVIAVGASTFQSDFPYGTVISLQVTPEAILVQAKLTVTLDGVTLYSSDALLPTHQAGETFNVEVRWNGLTLTRDPSPPWMPLQYWWLLTDSNGNVVTTLPQQQIYADLSHRAWIASEGVHVTVYTYGQSQNFISSTIAAGDAAIGRLQASYGYALPYRPALVFYNSAGDGDADLSNGNTIPFGSFVVGRAYPGTSGVVMLARADDAYLQRTITHELAHLFQYQLGPRVFDAPHWWIEGDAKAQEPAASIERSVGYARNAAVQQNLPTLVSWDSRNYSNEASLDYVLLVGASFVTYLKTIYGAQTYAAFYGNWRAGKDFNGAFVLTYGKTLDELDQGWKQWLLNNDSVPIASSESIAASSIPAVMMAELPEGMARVNAYWLNFRDGPSLDNGVIALLSIGQLLIPLGRDVSGEWMLVELPDGTQGWLYSEYLDYDGVLDDLTVSLY